MADDPSATVAPADAKSDPLHSTTDSDPLRPANPWSSDRRSVQLTQVDADCVVLEPRKWSAVAHMPFVLACTLGPVAGLVYVVFAEGNADPVEVLILVVGLLFVSALLISGIRAPRAFQRWVRFDRRDGSMTISRRAGSFRRSLEVVRSRPLTDVIAVQLLDAGWQSEYLEIGETGTPASAVYRGYHLYQLNLVVDDRDEPRLNLASHGDAKWMNEAGQRLTGFLGVPLDDRIGRGR